MATLLTSSPSIPTLGDLLHRLGDVPAERVRYYPLPRTATEQDVIEIEARENRLFELIDGVLVEKGMGFRESLLAVYIASMLSAFVQSRRLGLVAGEAGMIRLVPGLVRIPDVAFIARDRLPGGRVPEEPIPNLSPNLAVEVLSSSNTRLEMERKRGEYFDSGTQLVWMVDPVARTVTVYTSSESFQTFEQGQTLDGGDVLPGFTLDGSATFGVLDA